MDDFWTTKVKDAHDRYLDHECESFDDLDAEEQDRHDKADAKLKGE